jgi:hypothetical protein
MNNTDDMLSTSDQPISPPLDLHPILEDEDHQHIPPPQVTVDPLKSVMEELNIDSSLPSSAAFSPTQIQKITKDIIIHLKKHGKVTTELIYFVQDDYSSSKKVHVIHT